MPDSKDIFEKYAERYDRWYFQGEGKVLAPIELKALKKALKDLSFKRAIEVGVGTGYFASRLCIKLGIDPAHMPLTIAERRGIKTVQGYAEYLPFEDSSFDLVLMVVTICFVDDPVKSFLESSRILKKGGYLITGIVPAESEWGKLYIKKGLEGHIFYSKARLFTVREVIEMGEKVGLRFSNAVSTLYQKPSETPSPEEKYVFRADEEAGFSVIVMQKSI